MLLINPKAADESIEEEITLDATNSVAREVIKNSLSGIERIVIKSDKEISKQIRKDINLLLDGLSNANIIEETKQRIVIQNLSFKKYRLNSLLKDYWT